MEDDARLYFKQMISDAADARLIIGIMQRCEPALSQVDKEVLARCYAGLMAATNEYLQIDPEGRLIGIEDQPPAEETPAAAPEPTPTPTPVAEPKPVQTKTTVVKKV